MSNKILVVVITEGCDQLFVQHLRSARIHSPLSIHLTLTIIPPDDRQTIQLLFHLSAMQQYLMSMKIWCLISCKFASQLKSGYNNSGSIAKVCLLTKFVTVIYKSVYSDV